MKLTDRWGRVCADDLQPEVRDRLPEVGHDLVDESECRVLIWPAPPGHEAAEEDDSFALFEARRPIQHVHVRREHVDGHVRLLAGESRLVLRDAEDDVGPGDAFELELAQPLRLRAVVVLEAAERERFDVVDPAGLGLRAPQVVLEVLDVRRTADEHHRVVIAAPIEPAVEALVGAGDLDSLLEQRRGISLGVRWDRGQQRDSRLRPQADELGENSRHPRVAGSAVVVRHSIVDDEDALDCIGVAVRELDSWVARVCKQRTTPLETAGPALRKCPPIDPHEPARLPALAAPNVDHARSGLEDGREAALLELEAEVGVLVVRRRIDGVESVHFTEQVRAQEKAGRGAVVDRATEPMLERARIAAVAYRERGAV